MYISSSLTSIRIAVIDPKSPILSPGADLTTSGKNGPLDHFGPILIDKANGLVI